MAIEDMTGMILSDASDIISKEGISDIYASPSAALDAKDDWIVIEQNTIPDPSSGKNRTVLSCMEIEKYLSEYYAKKNLDEVQRLAERTGFALTYLDNDSNNIDDIINSLDEKEKGNWIVSEASRKNTDEKRLVELILYDSTGDLSEETTEESTSEEVITEEKNMQEDENTTSPQDTSEKEEIKTEEKKDKTRELSYTTNSKADAKQGKSGVYAYMDRGPNYDVYYIIDFDDQLVYYFTDGENGGEDNCMRVKMTSGDLNSVLIITFHEGKTTWQEGLHFKWKNQPDHLVMQDEDGFEYDFYTTNLDDALATRDKKKMIDY